MYFKQPANSQFFRKSSIAVTYFKKPFSESSTFERPLRPVLVVRTRCVSTLSMISRYLKINDILGSVYEQTVREKVNFQSNWPADPITPSQKTIIQSFISYLEYVDNSIALHGQTSEPTINKVEVFISEIISHHELFTYKEKH